MGNEIESDWIGIMLGNKTFILRSCWKKTLFFSLFFFQKNKIKLNRTYIVNADFDNVLNISFYLIFCSTISSNKLCF
jgi:uncharacterized membrane protein